MNERIYVNPYSKEDYKIFENMYKETIDSKIDKNRRGFTVTLEQLEAMNMDPFMERALFGRTSKEWRESLDAKHIHPNVEDEKK